ncbi:predicted protein [Plenodomus lingam JN3]|uniref:Predicted protein n=1 Tax=Leptosphaeria maculans (strain JN3 / isolate v23.1.3 / race Av1-4-5-6-7-8) TaxID=985895 RepID=E5A2A5_LEPMJ|nr:predicted protein [Plenodomus lingam JN3]CBX97540.1 predicted protein [Plenodomus lingam JN3]
MARLPGLRKVSFPVYLLKADPMTNFAAAVVSESGD